MAAWASGRLIGIRVGRLRGRGQLFEAAEQEIEDALGTGRRAGQRKDQRGAKKRAANPLRTKQHACSSHNTAPFTRPLGFVNAAETCFVSGKSPYAIESDFRRLW
jgi:hypothetical protein